MSGGAGTFKKKRTTHGYMPASAGRDVGHLFSHYAAVHAPDQHCLSRKRTDCCSARSSWMFFFFQAEDGIRDKLVTGVQTCALPISIRRKRWVAPQREHELTRRRN